MKRKSLLLGLFALILCFAAQSQVVVRYQQGFEASGETSSYTVTSGTATPVTSLYSSGSRAIRMNRSSSGECILVLDTIDFTDNSTYQSYVLEFMHINNSNPTAGASAGSCGYIEVKRPGETSWHALQGNTHYDMSWGGGSSDFSQTNSFSYKSYSDWELNANSPSNSLWKKERFAIQNFVSDVSLSMRKLEVRFRLFPRTSTSGPVTNEGWYIDNIRVLASPQSLAIPVINMKCFPDLMNFPTSRAARIESEITTSASAGMCADSIYILYKVGASPNAQVIRTPMTLMPGTTSRYRGYIPFCGYDTLISYRVVSKDATINHNEATYPSDVSSWARYKSVRGQANNSALDPNGSSGSSTSYPFPPYGASKAQFIFDSATLAQNGFRAGSITSMSFMAAANANNSTRTNMQIWVSNVETNYGVNNMSPVFYTGSRRVVYDSSLVISVNAGTNMTINFQDTFFYAGKDIIMTLIYNHPSNPSAFSVRTISAPSTPSNKATIYQAYDSYVQFNPYTDNYFDNGVAVSTRPNVILRSSANMPLIYDLGVSGLITPNDSTSASAPGPNTITVTLSNYGVRTINAARIWYQIDDSTSHYYDWTGNLAGGATQNVNITTSQYYTHGYHTISVWTDDSVTSNGVRYRDHEPQNNTVSTRFVACTGPMSGNVTVGGPNADYASLSTALYVLSQCGVNGPLHLKLAAGSYAGPIDFPAIPGTSQSNYVQVEPANNTLGSVTFSTQGSGAIATLRPYIVNVASANHIRFYRIAFTSDVVNWPCNYLVRQTTVSTGCQYLQCSFTENMNPSMPTYSRATALFYSGGADSTLVKDCTFSRGNIGLSMVGPAVDNMAHGNTIEGCTLTSQVNTSLIVRNQVDASVDSCTMTGVLTNSSYSLLLQDCQGATRITRNAIRVTSGASALGATGFNGSANGYAVIANNMIVCDDDGTANMIVTPLNVITATYTKVVFNSIKMTAPAHAGVAAATFGGGTIDHCYFYNNIVSCFDTTNYAFNYIPNSGCVNYIGYNIYYSTSALLNKYNGINCVSFNAWQSQINDGNSQNVNPAFLASNPLDLRSYSQSVKNHALPFAEVTNDMFNTTRDAVSPCVGAFEFMSLPYDFEVYALEEPFSEYCNVPASAPLRVAIKNSGVNTYTPGTSGNLHLTYSRTSQAGVMSPTNSGSVLVNVTIPGDTTIIFNVGNNVQFPTNGILDTTYTFTFWLTSSIDPNPANDTSSFTVTSRYHYPAPTTIHDTVPYGHADTITLTQGVQTWPAMIYNSGRQDRSTLYWYNHPDSNYIFRGVPYMTPILYTDTTLYVRQRRDMAMVKITEVQTKKNGVGVTSPQQLWMNTSCNFAVELTNVGDYPAHMLGDTLQLVSNTSNLNKVYVFPDVTIQPGATMVIQYYAGINVDSVHTLGGTATVSPAATANLGVIYRDGRGIVDAVAFNSITTQTQWTALNVPAAVWSGTGITLNNTTAGVSRRQWPANANATPSNTQQYWQLSDSTHFMTLGTVNGNLLRYHDNGCPSDYGTVYVHISARPNVDIALEELEMPDGCGLSNEDVTVTIHNYGGQASGNFVMHYSINGTTNCTDTLPSLASNATTQHTFSVPANLYVANGYADFDIKVWVDNVTGDISRFNDTTSTHVLSLFTPGAPVVQTYDTVQYGDRDTLSTILPSNDSLAWYDRNMNPLDTVNTYVSTYLYANDTFYVTGFGTSPTVVQVGDGVAFSSFTGRPSPFCSTNKYDKEQFIYTADDLRAAGHTAGPISAIAFYLDSVKASTAAPNPSYSFDLFKIGIGSTADQSFASNNAWKSVTNVYSSTTESFSNANKGWLTFNFTTPYLWDGVSSIVVQVVHTAATTFAAGSRTQYTTAANTGLYKADNTTSTIETFSGNGTRSGNRPNVKFTFVDLGCEGPASPVYVTVVGTPSTDAALAWPDGSDTIDYSSCGPVNFDVKVRNMGSGTVDNYSIDYTIDGVTSSYNGTTAIATQQDAVVTVATPSFLPGRHVLSAVVHATGDTIHTNDTITRIINVSFCAGTYTIGAAATNDYHSFTEAIDTLNNAGINGPVVFAVQSGNYVEQLQLGAVTGSSSTNTITFRSATGDSSSVVLRYGCSNTSNYVLNIDGAQYLNFERMTIYATSSTSNGTYANAVTIANADHIGFNGAVIRVKGTINNVNASGVVVSNLVTNLSFDSCWLDSGYYCIKEVAPAVGTNYGIRIDDSRITNFWSQGVLLRKVNDVVIRRNQIRSGVSVTGRALTGIFVSEVDGGIDIERNNVVLFDMKNGGKRGIVAISCVASNTMRGKIYNNMCAMYGTGTTGQSSAGIFIDSSQYINVYYNTTRVFAGVNANATRAFSVQTNSSGIYVMNNIFSNNSKGYAYYAQSPFNIAASNYNVYYSTSPTRLAFWGAELPTLDTLRQTNSKDGNSLNSMPYFFGDDDLHLMYALYSEMAQYNTDVPTDIDGDIRPQIPQPCIGADERDRGYHDIAIMQFVEPTLDSNTVESDSLRVIVKLYNEGTSTETNIRWHSEIRNTQLVTPTRVISEISPTQVIYDTAYIQLPIGLIDTQYIHAVVEYAPGQTINDNNLLNNEADTVFFIEPAYDIQATQMFINDSTSGVHGCRLHATPVTIRLTNVGRKNIPVDYPITIGYQAILQTSGVTIPQIPLTHTESITLAQELEVNSAVDIPFVTPANFYPTGLDRDVVLRLRGWSTYLYDQKHAANLIGHDTTTYANITSKYTPNAPIASDLHIPYATWDTIHASQTDHPTATTQSHRPIRWYRDSTDAEPFFTANNYNQTTWWETPQYFHDSVYYLSCISTTGCTSYYQPVHVYLNPRVTYDAAIEAFTEPYDKVYMDNDTVKVRIINYGNQTISNIPVVYQFRRQGNNQPIIQEVTQICNHSIAPDETYVFKFDSLITFPTDMLTGNINYWLRAWTDLPTEQVRLNDTLRERLVVKQLPQNTFSTPELSSKVGLDIVQVSFNSLDHQIPEVGHTYLNFGDYNNPEVEHLRLIKGASDTMVVTVANGDDPSDYATGGYLTVYIDYNRDGVFQLADTVINGTDTTFYSEVIFQDTVHSRIPKRFVYTYPDDACLGHLRMRVALEQSGFQPMTEPFQYGYGQVQDYMLLVEDRPVEIDAAVGRIVSPNSVFIESDSTVITFMMVNKGSTTIESADIAWRRIANGSFSNNNFTWSGELLPGQSVPVSLPTMHINEGTANFRIVVNVLGDTISNNDTLYYQCHRFKTVTLIIDDNFDQINQFYAPRGYNAYSENVWQRGYPTGKPLLGYCMSDSTVWATNLNGMVSTGMRGNLSYLYTPYIDISQIRPDTMSFWLAHDFAENSSVTVQYWNYQSRWITLGSANDTLWYTDASGFSGATSGHAYVKYQFPTSHVSGEFQQRLQFRFVFKATEEATQSADGACLDNFRLGRAQRAVDVGVIAIVHPTEPKFGQTINPTVAIHNFGYDTAYSVNLAYCPYGSYLAKTGTYNGVIAPGESALYTFNDPFVVMSDFPDTFQICAYTTVNLDIYRENDSVCKDFTLSPLDNDMAMTDFLYPLDHIVAGDSILVTTRLRNYGQMPVSNCEVFYNFNNHVYNEQVDFEALLGRPLGSFEYFNYSFHQKVRASMGTMHLTAWVRTDEDDYPYNDTISKPIAGLSNITDLMARAIVVDTTHQTEVRFQLTIDNLGSRSANNFTVGYWYDNDTSTMVIEHFNMALPLASLASAYYVFDSVQPRRAGNPYTYVSAFVHVDGDNDNSNDTTSYIEAQYVDLRAVEVVVEENREDNCHVRLAVENVGNMSYRRPFRVNATINGTSIHSNSERVIAPGEVYHIDFTQTVPKNPNRQYSGSGFVSRPADEQAPYQDNNPDNNQTSVIVVQNYFDGIFTTDASTMSLDQNVPNPFSATTRIDFYIPNGGEVRFFVMDEMGRLVYQHTDTYADGDHSIYYGSDLRSSGVYYYGIECNGERLMRKMVFKK